MKVEIMNIKDIDRYSEEAQRCIIRGLHQSAQLVVDNTKRDLIKQIPKATTRNPMYSDTLVDAIYYGKVSDSKVKITVMGNRDSSSGTYRTRFFVGGTKERFVTDGYRRTKSGIKYVKYKKPMSTGKIQPTNSLSNGISNSRTKIDKIFLDIFNK